MRQSPSLAQSRRNSLILLLLLACLSGCATRNSPAALLHKDGVPGDVLAVMPRLLKGIETPPHSDSHVVQALMAGNFSDSDSIAQAQGILAEYSQFDSPPVTTKQVSLPALTQAFEDLAQQIAEQSSLSPDDINAIDQIHNGLSSGDIQPAILAALSRSHPAGFTPRQTRQILGKIAYLQATLRRVNLSALAGQSIPTAYGVIRIGTPGSDIYDFTREPEILAVLDPGGNDLYILTPVNPGQTRFIWDKDGADKYLGSDLSVYGLSVIDDDAGNDVYQGTVQQAASFGGIGILIDRAGNDSYQSGQFSQAAAIFGTALLIDLQGNDSYQIAQYGQAFASTGGVAILRDMAGNDSYHAAGTTDIFARGGGTSMAQGMGFGWRDLAAGGLAILADAAGNDTYEAELFAQGSGFYFAAGWLLDIAGNDSYRAARYAQGTGTHQAIGTLYDGDGKDSYALSVGVGQGMGLDLSRGFLRDDGGGDDRYQAGSQAQGSATANGVGILRDDGGNNRFSSDDKGRGRLDWERYLPTIGLLSAPDRPRPLISDFLPDDRVTRLGYGCGLSGDSTRLDSDMAALLRDAAPLRGNDDAASAAYRAILRQILTNPNALLDAAVQNQGFQVAAVLECWAETASKQDKAILQSAILVRMLKAESSDDAVILSGLLRLFANDASAYPAIFALANLSPQNCATRTSALSLASTLLVRSQTPMPDWIRQMAENGLHSPCLRVQASAWHLLRQQGVMRYRSNLPDYLSPAILVHKDVNHAPD